MSYLKNKGLGIDENFLYVCTTDDRGWAIIEKWSLASGKRVSLIENPPIIYRKDA